MNEQVKATQPPTITTTAVTSPSVPSVPSVPSDADLQALWDLGQLQFLANTLENLTPGSTLYNETLTQFQALYAQYNFNSAPPTFQYTGANGNTITISITDPNIAEVMKNLPILSSPPTAADVATFQQALDSTTQITWSNGQTETLLARMLLLTVQSQYTMQFNLQNTTTNTALLMFYLSFAGNPSSKIYGLLDQILSEGYYDGAMLNNGNVGAIAQVLCDEFANNPILKSIVAAGLQAYPNDPLCTLLGQLFASDTPGNAANDWDWESRFFPVFGLESQQPTTTNAIPLVENSYLENRTDLAKKAMEHQDAAQAPKKLATTFI